MRDLKGFYDKKLINKNIATANTEGVADPFIYRFCGLYYLIYTAPKGLKCYVSKDLIHYKEVDNGINPLGYIAVNDKLVHAFAPELIYWDGYFYIVTSMSGNGHYILRSNNIIGPYDFITDNLEELIDGSFYIDNKFNKFLLRASESGICKDKLLDDFTNFQKKDDLIESKYYKEAKMGDWTEGPYLLKRYNINYLTFTGTHFLSDAYRVNYVSGKDEDNLKYRETLLLSTKKDFYGLGHSATFLAPNLDSYLITYHDMNDNHLRTINISRLLFSGEKIIINDSKNIHFDFERPNIEIYDHNELKKINSLYFINNKYINYTLEVAGIYSNQEIIFNYVDDFNYYYLKLESNGISFIKKVNDNDKLIEKLKFSKTINLNTIHTLRIQTFNGKWIIYFDNIEFYLNHKINLIYARIYLLSNNIKYLGLSNYSFGNSDNNEIKIDKVPATLFDISSNAKVCNYKNYLKLNYKENYIYYIYKNEEADYYLDINVTNFTLDNSINLRINDNEIIEFKVNKKGLINLDSIHLKKGINKIEIFNSYGLNLDYIFINDKVENILNISMDVFNSNKVFKFGKCSNNYQGIYFENDRNAFIIDHFYSNYILESEVYLRGNQKDNSRFAGLFIENRYYGKENNFENGFSLDGYALVSNNNYVMIFLMNFDHSKLLFKTKIYDFNLKLKVMKCDNKLKFYVNDNEIYQCYSNSIRGRIGLYNNHQSILFKTFKIKEV